MKGKLIILEGTDCSGKETQAQKLIENLANAGFKVFRFSFPCYDSPTGRIIGGPFLGKTEISSSWFKETSPFVDPLVSSLFYAADRKYNIDVIKKHLNQGEIVIVDRYVESNMAHQGGKLKTKEERLKLFKKIVTLEYDILELPKPDGIIFLYMPYQYAHALKMHRNKNTDIGEDNKELLLAAEATYLELCDLYNFIKIPCVKNDILRTIDDISADVYKEVRKIIE